MRTLPGNAGGYGDGVQNDDEPLEFDDLEETPSHRGSEARRMFGSEVNNAEEQLCEDLAEAELVE